MARRAALETEFPKGQLESWAEYAELADRIETHRSAVDGAIGDMSADSSFIGAVREIVDGDELPPTEDENRRE